MGMFDDVEGIVKRQMVLFFVVDTSGSMQGTKIGAVNTAIREVLPELKDAGGSDVDLKVACLTFSRVSKSLSVRVPACASDAVTQFAFTISREFIPERTTVTSG